MSGDMIEAKGIDCFVRAFELCKVGEGEVAAIVCGDRAASLGEGLLR